MLELEMVVSLLLGVSGLTHDPNLVALVCRYNSFLASPFNA